LLTGAPTNGKHIPPCASEVHRLPRGPWHRDIPFWAFAWILSQQEQKYSRLVS
jgi:hypothetical protein